MEVTSFWDGHPEKDKTSCSVAPTCLAEVRVKGKQVLKVQGLTKENVKLVRCTCGTSQS